jgi:hypothetical protein
MCPFWKVSEQKQELWSGCEVGQSEDMKVDLGGEFPLLWQLVDFLKHVNEELNSRFSCRGFRVFSSTILHPVIC